jgi:hypothetical protein
MKEKIYTIILIIIGLVFVSWLIFFKQFPVFKESNNSSDFDYSVDDINQELDSVDFIDLDQEFEQIDQEMNALN